MTNRTVAQRAIWPRLVAVLGLSIFLGGCMKPTSKPTKPGDAQALAEALAYVKARNGLCFGVGTTSRINSSGQISYSNHIAHVPCEVVGL